jgi:hypothetical protein
LHVTVTTGSGLTTELIHFTTSLLISAVLLVLTLRAARLPGTPLANILFAVCGIFWSAGGLASTLLLAAGMSHTAPWVLAARAAQYSGAAVFPVAILLIWRPFAALPWQQKAARGLEICAGVSAAAIMAMGWWFRISPNGLAHLTAYNAGIVLALGAAFTLRRGSTPRAVYLPSLAIVVALCGAVLMMLPGQSGWLQGLAAHLILLMVLCTFLLFARFRLADRFAHHHARCVAGDAPDAVSGRNPRVSSGAERECAAGFDRFCGPARQQTGESLAVPLAGLSGGNPRAGGALARSRRRKGDRVRSGGSGPAAAGVG